MSEAQAEIKAEPPVYMKTSTECCWDNSNWIRITLQLDESPREPWGKLILTAEEVAKRKMWRRARR